MDRQGSGPANNTRDEIFDEQRDQSPIVFMFNFVPRVVERKTNEKGKRKQRADRISFLERKVTKSPIVEKVKKKGRVSM